MENDKNKLLEKGQINQAMRLACKSSFGVLDQGFLCQPVSLLNPHEPICVSPDSTLIDVWQAFRQHKIGCVLVTDKSSRLIGIFSERDLVLKVEPEVLCKEGCKVEEMMTPEPQCCAGDDPIAYALNL
ncbi:MAG: CBS domain-containing protein, partial [Bdellovibrionales bacterium]|nr:CBS domain-containing protein [Bdellovibrionales bacterium]